MTDGGYRKPTLWLSDGWASVLAERWEAPKYWEKRDGEWWCMTLQGFRPVEDSEPVTHLSHYEADAFAAWASMTHQPAHACQPNLNGNSQHETYRSKEIFSMMAIFIQSRSSLQSLLSLNHPIKCSAMSGSGLVAPICHIPATKPPKARSENIMGSLCPTKWCFVEAPA